MRVGLIGGTGVDEMPAFAEGRIERIVTRYGSADVIFADMSGTEVIFIPRHGLDHSVPPSLINYRAQIAAIKKLRVERMVGICAVGSLTTALPAGSFAVLSDFIDLTKRRADTFFDQPGEPVVHTDFTHPYCPTVSKALSESCSQCGANYQASAVYVGVEGPRYETPAEIRLYASWGGHVIGMTNTPEAPLAREAGLCYGALATVTNLAAGLSAAPLSHEEVRKSMLESGTKLREIITSAVEKLANAAEECECAKNSALRLDD